MEPLWAFQASCVEALLARAGPAAGPASAASASSSQGHRSGGGGGVLDKDRCAGGCGFGKHPAPVGPLLEAATKRLGQGTLVSFFLKWF
jgi:hypothetical protein